jgi:hypothetical protein
MKLRTRNSYILSIIVLPLLFAFSSSTLAIVINATDSGWYNNGHNSSNKNYAAGPNDTYRNYFVFDLSGVTGTITSATLRLDSGLVSGTPTYDVYDVTTDVGTLMATHASGTTATNIHSDLGSGDFYGSGMITGAHTIHDFVLNSSAFSSMNAATGLWALGGRNNDSSYTFWGTNSSLTRQLIIETSSVPESSTLALFGLGLLALGLKRRKRG